MMGLGRADIEQMSFWEYEARLWQWIDAHGSGDEIQAPDPHYTQKMIDKINNDPRLYA